MKITYIYHSCYVVEFDDVVLIFDYFKGELPNWDRDKKVIVFASHKHQDHFSLEILRWINKYNDISYVLSNDIKFTDSFLLRHGVNPNVKNLITRIGKRAELDLNVRGKCLKIQTLKSTDEGVAFLINYEGKCIYHAGDLNWWSWSGSSKEENEAMENEYKKEISRLSAINIDIAFVVLDPRQEERYGWGMDYFLKTVTVNKVFPMHCWEKYSIIKQFIKDSEMNEYSNKIMDVIGEGQSFQI